MRYHGKTKNETVYGVESFYDYDTNYVAIFHASLEDVERDGDNYVGSSDAYRFNCYRSLEEAIENAGFWAPKITYAGEFSEEETAEIKRVTESLVTDKIYTEKFGRSPEKAGWIFEDIRFVDNKDNEPEFDL